MIYSISWKTYFVFMCFNYAFISVIYYTFVETNGYPLEKIDAIFEEAYKKENLVWTTGKERSAARDQERRMRWVWVVWWRKRGKVGCGCGEMGEWEEGGDEWGEWG